MDRFTYRLVNEAQILQQSFPEGQTSDDVVYSIYDIDDAAADVSNTAMTSVTGNLFKASWTPTEAHNYRIDFFNRTLDVHYYEYVKVTGSITGSGGGSSAGSTLTVLRTKFLKLIDNYNANDLTGTNSSGELADLCLNDGLQLIYSIIKSTRHMEAYVSTSLVSVADQDYIEISGISDADEIRAIRDTSNDLTLTAISPDKYFRLSPDRANSTGVPVCYCRIFNRVYLHPRPASVITYSTEYIKLVARLSADSDQAGIPSKFDDWIMKEARVLWFMMEDPRTVPPIVVLERDQARDIYLSDMQSEFDLTSQVGSAFDRMEGRLNLPNGPWDRVM